MKITDLQEPSHIQNIIGGKYFLKMIAVFFIVIVSFLFIFSLNSYSAQKCKTIRIPTYPQNVENLPQQSPCDCSGVIPEIIASSSTIAPGGSITMYVDSGGLACPPYTWSTTSNGYSFNKSETNNDLEEVTLSCASGSCGVDYNVTATVTVTDNCGATFTAKIRNTAGEWKTATVECSTREVSVDHWGYNIVGDRRYELGWRGPGPSGLCVESEQWNCDCSTSTRYCAEWYNTANYNPCYTGQLEFCKGTDGEQCEFCYSNGSGGGVGGFYIRFGSAKYQDWSCP